MQVVLSQRMSKPFAASPLALYRALRTLNPSPYMFYFDFEDFHVVGASPEILVRLEHQDGERHRAADRRHAQARRHLAEDEALAADLLADPKERAEHLMLLDLGRNDVGRVAKTGTVKVTDQFIIERYSHVMHIVSNVEGRTEGRRGCSGRAQGHLPGRHGVRRAQGARHGNHRRTGTQQARHLCRRVGYLGFNGDMDLCHRDPHRGDQGRPLHVQAGAGIVADSDPDSEWQETLNKARAQLRAAEMAEAGLDTRFD
jgi:anthranilate synthase component 1